jgi:hypothetical protein
MMRHFLARLIALQFFADAASADSMDAVRD